MMPVRFLALTSIAAMLCAALVLAQESGEPIIPPPGSEEGQQPDTQMKQDGQATQDKAKPEATEDGATQETKQKQEKDSEQSEKAEATTKQKSDDTAQDSTTKKKTDQESDSMTTGSTDKAVEVSSKEKTVIREKVSKNVERVDRKSIDIDISVGVRIPSRIHLVAIPSDIIEIVPAYRGYLFFVLDDGTIVIVHPDTLEIVYLI